jgi:mannonate dehydratase
VPATLRDDDIQFLQQIGLRSVLVNFRPEASTLDEMRRVQERFARHNIQIFGGLNYTYRSLKIQLGQPGRDEDIAQYQAFLRSLGKLDIPVATYDFHPANTYTTATVTNRGYTAREFSVEDFRARVEKQRFDREYSADEIWANYSYFMKAVLPVAEEANVALALHPDDPPLEKMNGVAKLFSHYDGYRRAEEIAAGSRHWGLTFCVGTWSEGGDRMGKNVFEMIRDFGRRGKIYVIHFRNVSSPLPRFHETFPDDGYLDMYQVMKSLREAGFKGCAVPDHIPRLAGDDPLQRAGLAYCIAIMRAMLRRANEEVG